MRRKQRVELAFIARENAVHLVGGFAEPHSDFAQTLGCYVMLLDKIEHRGDEALYGRCGRPQAQRDMLELPTFAKPAQRSFGLPAVRVRVVKPAIGRGEKFLRREEAAFGEQRRHETRERAAALMELDGRRAPRGEGTGRLTARKR